MPYNLGLTSVAPNQNQKEVTINDNETRLDNAMTENLALDMSAGDVVVTSDDAQTHIYFASSGNAVADRMATFPAGKRMFWFENGGSEICKVAVGATEVSLAVAEIGGFYADGTTDGLKKLSSSV